MRGWRKRVSHGVEEDATRAATRAGWIFRLEGWAAARIARVAFQPEPDLKKPTGQRLRGV
jgi:hypothetical protein